MPLGHVRPFLLLLVCAPLVCACGEGPRPAVPEPLSWFALERATPARGETDTDVLRLDPSPRWFVGPAELVSEDELVRRRTARGVEVYEARVEDGETPEGMRWLATVPEKPRRLRDMPTVQVGARLALAVARGADMGELTITLTLHAGERALWRELEHRATNLLPFLIGLEVGGRPVRVEATCFAHQGGISRFERLVEAGASRRWTLRVHAATLRDLGDLARDSSVSIVALFSERQHTTYAVADGELPAPDALIRLPFEGKPVLIRSNVAAVPPER